MPLIILWLFKLICFLIETNGEPNGETNGGNSTFLCTGDHYSSLMLSKDSCDCHLVLIYTWGETNVWLIT